MKRKHGHSSTRLGGFISQPEAMFFHYGFHNSPVLDLVCARYILHSFLSSFFNFYFHIILLSTSVTPTWFLWVLQLNFHTISHKCYVRTYYIKYWNPLCTTICTISASYSGWCWTELIHWCESRLSWLQDFAALLSRSKRMPINTYIIPVVKTATPDILRLIH